MLYKNNIVINYIKEHEWIVVSLIMFAFIVMSNFTSFAIADRPYKFVLGIIRVLVLSAFFHCFLRQNKKTSVLYNLLICMEILTITSTFLNNFIYVPVLLFRSLIFSVSALMFALIVEYYKNNGIVLIDGLMLDFEISIYINFVSIMRYMPSHFGERLYFFLEYYNAVVLWYIPAIMVAILYAYFHKKYIRSSFLIAVVIVSVFATHSATTTLAFVGIGFVLFVGYLFKKQNIVTMRNVVVVSILANIFIMLVFSGGKFPWIDALIERVLHRDVTFTGRTTIWKLAFDSFLNKPLFGNGYGAMVELPDGRALANASHNEFLQRLFITGIPGLLLYLLFLEVALRFSQLRMNC